MGKELETRDFYLKDHNNNAHIMMTNIINYVESCRVKYAGRCNYRVKTIRESSGICTRVTIEEQLNKAEETRKEKGEER